MLSELFDWIPRRSTKEISELKAVIDAQHEVIQESDQALRDTSAHQSAYNQRRADLLALVCAVEAGSGGTGYVIEPDSAVARAKKLLQAIDKQGEQP